MIGHLPAPQTPQSTTYHQGTVDLGVARARTKFFRSERQEFLHLSAREPRPVLAIHWIKTEREFVAWKLLQPRGE